MKTDIKNENLQKQTIYLNSEAILKYLLGTDEHIDTLITCRGNELNMVTTDFEIYEAIGSLKNYDNFKINKLVKLFEVIDIKSHNDRIGEKNILKHERVEELRKLALKK